MSDNNTFTFTEEEMSFLASALAPSVFSGEYYSSEFKTLRDLVKKLSQNEHFEGNFEDVVNILADSGFKDIVDSFEEGSASL